MTLTDAQIDRYSRQIIVPRIGGRVQERLLGARLLLAGDARDIEAPLAYLVGAGVGAISIEAALTADKIAEIRELNSDVNVTDELKAPIDLALLIVGSEAARKAADEIANGREVRALVIARLDAPGKIAFCSNASMLAQFGERSEAADFIVMLATAEAFKLLAGFAENPPRATIQFDGYATTTRVHP